MRAVFISAFFLGVVGTASYSQTDIQKPNHPAGISKGTADTPAEEIINVQQFDCRQLPELNSDAENLDGEASFKLSVLYAAGQCVPKDDVKAAHVLATALKLRNTHAQLLEALLLRKCDCAHDKEVIQFARFAAEKGNQTGQFLLADAYYKGKNTTQDYKEAVQWAQRAANQGNSGAMVLLGAMYAGGHGVTKDIIEADKWFSLADKENINDPEGHNLLIEFERHISATDKLEAKRRADIWKPKLEEQE